MWELGYKEDLAPKNLYFQIVLLEKTLESPLDIKEIQLVSPKGNQAWIFIGRTDAEAEAPILWPPDIKSQLTGRDPDAGKDWGQKEKGATEDEMVGWQSPTQWTWVWANSGRWWRTGKPGILQSMGSQSWIQLFNWTTIMSYSLSHPQYPTVSDCYWMLNKDFMGEWINETQGYYTFFFLIFACNNLTIWDHLKYNHFTLKNLTKSYSEPKRNLYSVRKKKKKLMLFSPCWTDQFKQG